MKAKNIHKTAFNLESGQCKPGDTAEFTGAEFMFLAKMGRAEQIVDKPKVKPSYKKLETD